MDNHNEESFPLKDSNSTVSTASSGLGPGNPPNGESPTGRWARIATIVGIGLIVSLFLMEFLSLTAQSIALLFVAIVIGEAVSPIVNFLARVMPRGVAVGMIFLALVGSIAGLGYYLAPQIAEQTSELVEGLPGFIEDAAEVIEDAPMTGDNEVWSGIQNNLGNFTMTLVSIPMTVFSSLAQVVIVAFMAAYWIISRRSIREFLESLVPASKQGGVRELLMELSETVGGYVRGTGIGALAVGTVVYIGLSLLGVNFPLIMAIFAAFGELIPIIGPNLAAIPAIIVAFLDSWQLAVAVAIFYIVLQQVESNILVPLIMKNQANIPPLLVIISVSFGGAIAGILGAIVAIPAAGALRVIVVRVVAPAIRRWTGAESEPLLKP